MVGPAEVPVKGMERFVKALKGFFEKHKGKFLVVVEKGKRLTRMGRPVGSYDDLRDSLDGLSAPDDSISLFPVGEDGEAGPDAPGTKITRAGTVQVIRTPDTTDQVPGGALRKGMAVFP